jgi:hypothetical protein
MFIVYSVMTEQGAYFLNSNLTSVLKIQFLK